jgi:hypothetical protein
MWWAACLSIESMSPTSQTCFRYYRILVWETKLQITVEMYQPCWHFSTQACIPDGHGNHLKQKFSVPWTFFLLQKMIMWSLWQVSGSKVLDLLRFGIMELWNSWMHIYLLLFAEWGFREVATMVRALGFNPTDEQVEKLAANVWILLPWNYKDSERAL